MGESVKIRSGAIDALRVVGVVAIVAGHTWDNHLIRVGIYTWHVPLFFFLTGYLWTVKRPLRNEVAKRAQTLLLPYTIWLAVIAVLFETWLYLSGEFKPEGMFKLLWGGSQLGRPFSAFWFVTALFIAVIILRLLQHLPSWTAWAIAAAGLVAAYFAGPFLASLPLSAGVAWPAMIFILAGSGFRNLRHRIGSPLATGSLLTGAAAALAVSGVASPFDIKKADFGTPVLSIVMAVSICAGLLLLSEVLFARLSPQINHVATVLALGGFLVVLTHAVPLWVLRVGDSGSVLGFVAALVAPWAFAIVVGRTSMGPYLLGAPHHLRNQAVSVQPRHMASKPDS